MYLSHKPSLRGREATEAISRTSGFKIATPRRRGARNDKLCVVFAD